MEHFVKELQLIVNDEIRENTKKVLDEVNPVFYESGASTTGKYHPTYAIGYEGLYRHTCAAVKIAFDLTSLEHIRKQLTENERDYIIAALILHDSCKCGKDWTSRYTLHEHPLEAVKLIREVLGNDGEPDSEYVETVAGLVASHMGEWNANYRSKIVLPKPLTLAQQIVHEADYLASRRYLEFVFDNEVVELSDEGRLIKKVK